MQAGMPLNFWSLRLAKLQKLSILLTWLTHRANSLAAWLTLKCFA